MGGRLALRHRARRPPHRPGRHVTTLTQPGRPSAGRSKHAALLRMCEAKPGPRCANDTRDAATTASAQYQAAHPDGPPVDPISAAREVEAERVRAQGHHRMLTESAAMSLDNAMGAAQSNVREARRALHSYTR